MTTTWRDRLILVAPLLGTLLLLMVSPDSEGPTFCPFALCTGTACPGCGMTRAASSLIRGDFGGALTLHPLVPLVGLQLAVGWVWFVLRRRGLVRPLGNRPLNVILIVTAVALLAVWVARLLSGTLPPV
ncbi:MAG: DUF2752 domain-containing protein [Acidimicrobiia bacterium]|jgi:hypothetical protein